MSNPKQKRRGRPPKRSVPAPIPAEEAVEPNEETIEAIEEVSSGGGESVETVEELFEEVSEPEVEVAPEPEPEPTPEPEPEPEPEKVEPRVEPKKNGSKVDNYLACCRACRNKWFSTCHPNDEKCPECGHTGVSSKK